MAMGISSLRTSMAGQVVKALAAPDNHEEKKNPFIAMMSLSLLPPPPLLLLLLLLWSLRFLLPLWAAAL